MVCEKCGNDMKCFNKDSLFCWECTHCGWKIATTCIDKIFSDENKYTVKLIQVKNFNISAIKTISKIVNCNYIEAKKLIQSVPTVIFNGTAVETDKIKEKLENLDIIFTIIPDFPY